MGVADFIYSRARQLVITSRKKFGILDTFVFEKQIDTVKKANINKVMDGDNERGTKKGLSPTELPPSKRRKNIRRNSRSSDEPRMSPHREGSTEAKEKRIPKRKVAMLLAYNGTGYYGMQVNPGMKTIEQDLMVALHKAGAVSEDNKMNPQKISFQRTARTDKGVHAGGQVVSMKLMLVPDLIKRVNENLCEQIRCFGVKRTLGKFNCKNACDARTYEYVTPTYAFADPNETDKNYRISPEKVAMLRKVLGKYKGTHNFHNYTSGKTFKDMASNRYIMNFSCSDPYMINVETQSEGGQKNMTPLEVIVLKVKGQSFVLHQIRKMVGVAMAIVRGEANFAQMEESFKEKKIDLPKAPGLGLVLSRCHFDYYNKKVTQEEPANPDDKREGLDWENDPEVESKLNAFKQKYILNKMMETEVTDREILEWLNNIQAHSFQPLPEDEDKIQDKCGQMF